MGLVAKAFQDIITFSRNSNGTYVNSNGYITNSAVSNYLGYSNQPENALWTKSNSFVQQNLLTYSQDFDNAAWSKNSSTCAGAEINATIAPDGTLTADAITEVAAAASHSVSQNYTAAASPHCYSVYLKKANGSTAPDWMQLYTGGVSAIYANFNLSTGVVGSSTATSAAIQNIGNGWYRCSIVFTPTAGVLSLFTAFTNNTDTVTRGLSYLGAVTSNVYAWGAQLVQGSVPGDYRATTSAALPCLYADYNGALRARKLCEDNVAAVPHRIFQGPTTVGTSSLSIIAKAAERSWVYLRFIDASSTIKQGWFNLATGTLGTIESGMTGSIQSAGNGYYRCTFSGPALVGVNTTLIGVTNADATAAYTGDGSSGIYIADAQLNDGSAATAYWDNATGSATYAPRFDYDPATLAAKGLLVEESRANLLLQSNDFQTSWNAVNITRTLNSTLSPDGNVNGVKLAATAAAATNEYQDAVVAATAATGSVFVKQGTGATTANTFALRNVTTATDLVAGTLNYSTGVFTYSVGSTGVVVTNAGNGFWRVQLSATAGITSGNTVRLYVGFSGAVATAGDFLYAYGAQLEAGAFATSYIPTVASQVTRAADVASVNTLSPWFNSVTGTLYAEGTSFVPDADGTVRMMAALTDTASYTNAIRLERLTGTWRDVQTVGGASTSIAGAWTGTQLGKLAGAYQSSNSAGTFNAAVPTSVGTATMPSGIAYLAIGGNGLGSANQWNGHLRRITYYPRRLTNAELQTLTTL